MSDDLETLIGHFNYLDRLRDSGATNMWGSASWLESAHDIGREEAKATVIAWMKTFDGETSVEARARKAIEATRP